MATKRVSSASGRMYTYHNMIVRYLIFRSDHTTFTNVNELSSSPAKRSFWALSTILKLEHFTFLDLMPSKTLWKLKRMWTNCRARPGNAIFSRLSTLLETVCVFRLDAVQKTIQVKKNVHELSDSLGKHRFEYYQHS